MEESITEFAIWIVGVFIIIAEILMGLHIVFTMLAPSEREVQCNSIVGAKWSGENCYKNGVRINFDAK